MIKTTLVMATMIVGSSYAWSQATSEYRWFFYTGTGGVLLAAVKEKSGYTFEISCASAGDKTMAISLYDRKPRVAKLDLQVVIDDENFQFELSNGSTEIAGRIEEGQLLRLVKMLQKTEAKSFLVELPATSSALSFSTLGVRKTTAGILDGCIGDNLPKQPAVLAPKPFQVSKLVTNQWVGRMVFGQGE